MTKVASPVVDVCAFSFKKINNEIVYFRGKQWQQIDQSEVSGSKESGKDNQRKSYFLLGAVLCSTVAAFAISTICRIYDER